MNTLRRLLLILTAVLTAGADCLAGEGGSKKAGFGLEWGAGTCIFEHHRYVYTDEVFGTLMDPDSGNSIPMGIDVYFLMKFNVLTGKRSALSLESGLYLQDNRRVLPLMSEYTFYPRGYGHDGVFYRFGGGVGIPLSGPRSLSVPARGSIGYRLSLSEKTGIDISASLWGIAGHPAVYNRETGKEVPQGCIRKNNAFDCSLTFGIALDF